MVTTVENLESVETKKIIVSRVKIKRELEKLDKKSLKYKLLTGEISKIKEPIGYNRNKLAVSELMSVFIDILPVRKKTLFLSEFKSRHKTFIELDKEAFQFEVDNGLIVKKGRLKPRYKFKDMMVVDLDISISIDKDMTIVYKEEFRNLENPMDKYTL